MCGGPTVRFVVFVDVRCCVAFIWFGCLLLLMRNSSWRFWTLFGLLLLFCCRITISIARVVSLSFLSAYFLVDNCCPSVVCVAIVVLLFVLLLVVFVC